MPGAEQRGQLLFLLLAAKLFEAFAHGRADIARTAALRADGLHGQIVRLQPLRLQDPVALLLQGQIFLLELLHGAHRVALRPGGHSQHVRGRFAQLPLDLGQPRLLLIDRSDARAGGLLVLFFFTLQAAQSPLHNGVGICHVHPSSCSSRSTAARSRSFSSS